MQKAIGRESVAQAADQVVGQAALGRPDRVGVPFLGLVVVDGDEGRLAAHGQAHVLRFQVLVDLFAERVERQPGVVGEGRGDARLFVEPLHAHVEAEFALRRLNQPFDGRGGGKMRRGGERQMAFAGEQAGGGVEADPAGAGNIDFRPGVQVGEIMVGAGRAVERPASRA